MPEHKFGFKREHLTEPVWQGILAIYFELCKEREATEYDLEVYRPPEFQDHVTGSYADERIGSIFTPHSKLRTYGTAYDDAILEVDFYVNGPTRAHEDSTTEVGESVRRVEIAFQSRVCELLLNLGIAEPIPGSS